MNFYKNLLLQLLEKISVKEAIIISLRLGYVDNKSFSIESISNLEYQWKRSKWGNKKVLLLYKDSMTNFMNNTIYSISGNKIFILKETNKK